MVLSAAFVAAVLAQQPVVRSGATVVQVTVVARDRKGAFVSDLTAGDLAVAEDGKPVTPILFREVGDHPKSPGDAAVIARPPNTISNATGGAPSDVTVILLDRLNTRWNDQAWARDQLKVFFSKLRPDDRVAIYTLDGAALRVLHDFTSNAADLIAAMNGSARLTSAYIDAQSDPASAAILDLMAAGAANTTITALETVGQHLSSIPGRKNVIWVSSGFNVGTNLPGFNGTDAMEAASRALNAANISLYPIDPKGLPGVFSSVTATTTTFGSQSTISPNRDVLEALAQNTGGLAFLNNNDISGSVRKAIDDAEQHYEIDYESPTPATDGRYRQIAVTTRRSGVDLHYRRGYYALPVQAPGGDRKTTIGRAIGNPLAATGIPVSVTPRTLSGGSGVELSVHTDARGLALLENGGTWSGALDLAIAQVRPDGTTTIDVDTTVALHLTDDQHAALVESGINLTKTIAVAADAIRVAVVLRDATSGAVGSVVIPAVTLRPTR
jgi:VWFA-related protein